MITLYMRSLDSNYVSKTRIDSLEISKQEGEVSRANFTIILKANETNLLPQIGNEVVITYSDDSGSYKIFGGYVVRYDIKFDLYPGLYEVDIEAVDYTHALSRYVVRSIKHDVISVYDLVANILKNSWLDKEFIGKNEVVNGVCKYSCEPIDLTGEAKSRLIKNYTASYITVKEALSKITDYYPDLKFTIDENRNFLIYSDEVKLSKIESLNLTRPAINIFALSFGEDSSDYRNLQIVKGKSKKVSKNVKYERLYFDNLQSAGWFLKKEDLENLDKKYNDFYTKFVEITGYTSYDEFTKDFWAIPIMKIVRSDSGDIVSDLVFTFALNVGAILSEIKYTLTADDVDNIKVLSPEYNDRVLTSDTAKNMVDQENKQQDVSAIMVVYKSKAQDGRDIYIFSAENIDVAIYDEASGRYWAKEGAMWFFIENSNLIFRIFPLAKRVWFEDKYWDFAYITFSYTAKEPIVHELSVEAELQKRRLAMTPFNPCPEYGSKYSGGYWIRVESTDAGTKEEATAIAKRYLETYGEIPKSLSFETDFPFIYPGDTIKVTLPIYDIEEHPFRVTNVKIKDEKGTFLRVSVECIGSEKEKWSDFFRKLIKRDYEEEFMPQFMRVPQEDVVLLRDSMSYFAGTYTMIEKALIEEAYVLR